MSEVGIDISDNRSKSVNEFLTGAYIVVTVCDSAKEACPVFPGCNVIHNAFPDPASFKGPEKDVLEQIRLVRDDIKEWVRKTFQP